VVEESWWFGRSVQPVIGTITTAAIAKPRRTKPAAPRPSGVVQRAYRERDGAAVLRARTEALAATTPPPFDVVPSSSTVATVISSSLMRVVMAWR
jgi:hypothetical protein